jgi:hypothetical protein
MADMITWPKWMKCPVVDGYGVEPQNRRVVSEMEIGAVYRVEFDTDETVVSCSLFLNGLQSNWFEAFERDLLRQGSMWFKLNLWTGGRLVEHTARFRERPKLTEKMGEYSTYSFSLDLARREGLMPTALVEVLAFIDPEEFLMAGEILQKTVNEDYPDCMPFAA